uniref:Glucosylceramidase n=1 Tax=Pristionchus pacificus TaxID=54126 RepID=A0A8R1V4Z2_PRIPA
MFLLLFLVLLLLLPGASSSPCAKRFFPPEGANHIVCVCNATYCDEYKDVELSSNSAHIFSSSEGGDRMTAKTARISKVGTLRGVSGRIKLDPRVSYQEIIGFGGAFTDAAGINIGSLSESTRDRLMQTMFGKKGARYSTGRVPIASTDFSKTRYSYNDNEGDEKMSKFALADEDRMYKIPLITRALNLTGGDLRLFSSPWSSPGWMKDTGKMEGPGKLRKGLEEAWAKYYVRFFEEYLSHGIPFWATTVQNEPTSGSLPSYGWQTMFWNSTGERTFVAQHLGPVLAASEASKNVKIIALDDNRFWLPMWANEVYSDPIAASFISGVGVHWYFDALAPVSTLRRTHEAHPDKFILATEACAGSLPPFHGPAFGEWERAEGYAKSIILDLNNFVGGWTDWNIALDTEGGPTWAKNFVDSPIIVNATADEFLKQPMHYAMAHFSRFLRPGSRRIQSSTVDVDDERVMHTAFVFDGQRIVTILNTVNVEKEIAIEEVGGTAINVNIEPNSITTVIWKKQ